MRRHRGGGAGRIARLDRLDDGHVLLEHPRHASRHRQGEAAIAIHLNFHLLDQGPDARMPCGFRDRRMKGFVGLMEAVTISGPLHPALTLDQPVEFRYLFRTRGLGRESRRQLLERLADQDRFRQRGERNPGHKSPRLGKDVDQRLVGEPQDGFAHRRAADAVARRDLPLDDGFAGLALHRDDFRLEPAVEHLGRGFGAAGADRSGRTQGSWYGSRQAHEAGPGSRGICSAMIY